MKLQINKRKAKNIFIFSLLFLCSMNFEAKFHYFVYALFVFLILAQRIKIGINYKSLLYFALSLLMALYCMNEGWLAMLRCFSPVMMYVVGFNFTSRQDYHFPKKEDWDISHTEGFVYALIVSVCAGSFVHYLLNAVININSAIGRNTIDVWSGEVMAATGQACFACLMLGLAVAIIFKPVKRHHRYLGIVCIIATLAYNLVLSGRTIIFILIIQFFIGLIYINKIEKNLNKKISLWLKIFAFLIAIITGFAFNIFGIKDIVMQSNFFERFTNVLNFWDNSSRNYAKGQFILNAWKYPFGGLNLFYQYGYAHDLLLDGYDEFGLLGFLLLLIILCDGISVFYKFVAGSQHSHELKLASLCVYVSILVVFCVEPILAGMAWLFAIFCFINGFMDGMRSRSLFYESEINK